MNERFRLWEEEKYNLTKSTLDTIRTELANKTEYFKNDVHTIEYDETVAIGIKSGRINIPNNKEPENGFQITFSQLPNGKIYVVCFSCGIENDTKQIELHIFDDLDEIKEDKITDLVHEGINKSMKSSFLFI